MLITIFGGTGAIGAYFAYKLAKNNHSITLIGREGSKNLNRIKEFGLTLKMSNQTNFIPRSSFTYVGAYNYSTLITKQDLIIISLKQPYFSHTIAQQVLNLTNNNSIIGVISNGLPFYFLDGLNLVNKTHIESVDPKGEIIQLFKNNKIMTINPFMGSYIESPGIINVITLENKIKVDIGSKFIAKTKLDYISQIFNAANISTKINENIHAAILEKLQFALSINVMSALLNKSNGEVFDSENTQNYIKYIIKFTENIGKNIGLNQLRNYDKFKQQNISKLHYSSMHNDFKEGRAPEVKIIVSAPLELAYFFKNHNMINMPTKPIEMVEELIVAISNNNSVLPSQIEDIFHQAELALNNEASTINIFGEISNL